MYPHNCFEQTFHGQVFVMSSNFASICCVLVLKSTITRFLPAWSLGHNSKFNCIMILFILAVKALSS